MKRLLVTGGSGYLGRATCLRLLQRGVRPVILDDLSTSGRWDPPGGEFHQVDLTDAEATRRVWKKLGPVDGVIHFAAKALVGESVERPDAYFRNNVLATVNTAACAVEFGVPVFVHSSSCAVYGVPPPRPIPESAALEPINPYGESKWMSERVLHQYARVRGLRVLNLRYFNPAGATDDGSWGESHDPETHIVPRLVEAHLTQTPVSVYGTDYPTADGTCVRDFIHVEDLVEAHILALEALRADDAGRIPPALNLGAGRGVSIKELIRTAEAVFGKSVPVKAAPRRPGDPAVLMADIRLATTCLGWKPARSLESMIESHLRWTKKAKGGFPAGIGNPPLIRVPP